MRTSLLVIVMLVVLGAGSALAFMNNACKKNHHPWCAPTSDFRHRVKAGGALGAI
jgi:hypothetical protein